jgi:GxxExxY protein
LARFLCDFAPWREALPNCLTQRTIEYDLHAAATLEFVNAMTENEIAKEVVDAAYKIHSRLGPGLLESVYEVVLAYELRNRGLHVVRQLPVPIVYEGIQFEEGFRLDLLVEDKAIVEIKSVEKITGVDKKQLLTHLRLMDKRLGLLINFNVELIKDGMSRIVNGLEE